MTAEQFHDAIAALVLSAGLLIVGPEQIDLVL
jgi:hypothetical protein